MISEILAFLAMLNPFALFLYLRPAMKDLPAREYSEALIKAGTISLIVFLTFVLLKDFIFETLLNIDFEAFRIFGGIILFSFAFIMIVRGQKAFIQLKGSIDELAAEIALPYMVGAGTISLSILLRESFGILMAGWLLFVIMAIHVGIVIGLHFIRKMIDHKPGQHAFDYSMEVLLRVSGFFLGAIGIDMVLTGIRAFF